MPVTGMGTRGAQTPALRSEHQKGLKEWQKGNVTSVISSLLL